MQDTSNAIKIYLPELFERAISPLGKHNYGTGSGRLNPAASELAEKTFPRTLARYRAGTSDRLIKGTKSEGSGLDPTGLLCKRADRATNPAVAS